MSLDSNQAEVQAKMNAQITGITNAIAAATALQGEIPSISSGAPQAMILCNAVISACQPVLNELVAYMQGFNEGTGM